MLNSISSLGETGPEHKWSNETEFSGFFRIFGILGELHPKFRNEIPENFCCIRPPGIPGILGRMESSQ